MSVALALIVKPLILLVLALCVFAPAVYAAKRWLQEGRLKRVLLFRIHDGERYTFDEPHLRDGDRKRS